MAHSKKRRSSLFSLTARMQRRAPAIAHVIVPTDESHDEGDDDCPLCVAQREGRPISFDALYEPAYLAAEARRALAREKLAPGEEASLVETGRVLPNGDYELTSYTVDAEGCVYVTKNETRTFVMRVSPMPSC